MYKFELGAINRKESNMSYYTIFMSLLLVIAIVFNQNIAKLKKRKYLCLSMLVLLGAVGEVIIGAENRYFIIIELGTGLIILTIVLKMMIKSWKEYQNNMIIWILLVIFIIMSYIFWKEYPYIFKIRWIVISIASIFIYSNMCAIEQSIDGLTKLLNQNAFKNYSPPRKKCIIIIFDVNDFKYINDTFGHLFGDKILENVANILKETYGKYGKCYRIGGDEFSVILENKIEYLDELNTKFIEKIKKKRMEIKELPNISFGYSMYIPKISEFEENIKDADQKMYKYKKEQKKNK